MLHGSLSGQAVIQELSHSPYKSPGISTQSGPPRRSPVCQAHQRSQLPGHRTCCHTKRSRDTSCITASASPWQQLHVVPLVSCRGPCVYIANHMEMIVINIDNFRRFLVPDRMRERPTDMNQLGIENCTFPVRMVQLGRTD